MSLEESKSRKEKKTENQKHEHTSCTHAPTSALLHRAESVDAENFEHPQRPGSLPEIAFAWRCNRWRHVSRLGAAVFQPLNSRSYRQVCCTDVTF